MIVAFAFLSLALAVALLARGPVEPEGRNREWNLRF
jgi:hypothetical protein